MTSTEFSPAPTMANYSVSTQSYANHRAMHHDSILRTGRNAMPPAWQTRGVPHFAGQSQYGAPVRSILDIIADPFRWLVATKLRKYTTLGTVSALVLTLIF